MLRTLPQTRDLSWLHRLAAIGVFTLLTILSAQLEIPRQPVPFTMQPLVVMLAGMVLGGRDGALSMFFYVSLIALGFPFDANHVGTAALFGPTGGYLLGFVVAAGVIGLICEYSQDRFWMRWLAGVVGIAIIYLFGMVVLRNITGMNWSETWAAGGEPFLVFDLIKAVIAAGLSESARAMILRSFQR